VTTLTWLHLSDFHFGSKKDWRQDRVLDHFKRDIKGLLDKANLQPDWVFVTGDIAFSGKPEQYQIASENFREINKILGLRPSRDWFIAPGNHDVDRDRVDGMWEIMRSQLTEAKAPNYLESEKTWAHFKRPTIRLL